MNTRLALITLATVSFISSCKEPEIDLTTTAETPEKIKQDKHSASITRSTKGQASKKLNSSTKSTSQRDSASLPALETNETPDYIFRNAAQLDAAWEAQNYEATQELFSDWLAQDQGAALNYLIENVQAKDAVHYSPSIRSIIAEIKPDEAIEFLRPLQKRRELYLNVAAKPLTDYAKNDPEGAYLHLEELENKLTQRELARKLGSSGAFGSGQSAIEWANTQGESLISHAIVTSATERWLQTNGRAATDFISQANSPEKFAEAITRHINNHARKNPQSMMVWAQSISNEELSQIAVDHAGQRWLDIDPDGFEKWQEETFKK